MSRTAARIKHDEIVRMVKAVQSCGLPVARVSFDGDHVDVIIGISGEKPEKAIDEREDGGGLIREPQV